MGSCCSSDVVDPNNELNHPETTLKGITYTIKDLMLIVRIQTNFRGWMARKRVKVLKEERAIANPFF